MSTLLQTDPRLGAVLGRYRLTREIGRGGMGVVYEAEHEQLGRHAAVKVIHPEVAGDAKVIRRFTSEAMTVARLQHTNIVDVYDVGESPEPFAVMELLRGRSLAGELHAGGAMPEARAIFIVGQALGALGVVHERKIVHRDIKPDNIFLVDDGVRPDHVKVLDFGIAKIREGAPGASAALTGGAVIGTPLYMAPEQIEGRTVDSRTDLYALGLVLYEMLVGRPAFDAPTLTALLSKQLLELPPPPLTLRGDLSAKIDAVVMRAIAKRPDDRFASAAEMLAALGWSAPGRAATPVAEPARALPSTLGQASGEMIRDARASARRMRRLRGLLGAGVLASAMMATMIMLHLGASSTEKSPPAPAVAPAPPPPPSPDPAPTAKPTQPTVVTPEPAPVVPAPPPAAEPEEDWSSLAARACGRGHEVEYAAALAHLTPEQAAAVAKGCTKRDRRPSRRQPSAPAPAERPEDLSPLDR